MAIYTVHLDFGVLAPPTCPACGAPDVDAVEDERQSTFHCDRCGEFWIIDFGNVRRAHSPHSTARDAHRPMQRPPDLLRVPPIGATPRPAPTERSCGSG